MGNEEIFGPRDAEHEIGRFERKAKQVFWKTPQNREIDLLIPSTVYPPREDTDLMAQTIAKLPKPGAKRLLEIGCGSGAISVFAAQLGFTVTACDINPYAVAASRHAAVTNGVTFEVREGGPGPTRDGTVEQWAGRKPHDIIVWNLPYLTHDSESQLLGPMEEAALLDTDRKGLVSRLLKHLQSSKILSEDGLVFLLISNNQKGIIARKECLANGFAVRVVASETFEDGECLEVLGIWRPYHSKSINFVESIPSTNTALLQSDDDIGTLLHAGVQSSGHGRRGRPWSHEEQAFAGSWVLDEIRGVPNPNQLQLRAGLALHQAIVAMDIPTELVALKWPNDVLLRIGGETRKVGGVLIESRSQGKTTRIVLGIGCNMTSKNHHKKEYSLASMAELSEHASTEKFLPIIHASVASWLEDKEGIEAVRNDNVISLFETQFLASISSLGEPIYRNSKMQFHSMNSDGNIQLIDQNQRLHLINDGEDVAWAKFRPI